MICPSCKAENAEADESCFRCGQGLFAVTQGSVVASRYEILSRLGKGGMGTVYRAHDRVLDETVALKVLRPDFAQTEDMALRFRSEIKLARKVSHRNVCRIHEYGEDGRLRYISMELIDGVNLMRAVRERGGLPPGEAYEVAIQAAKGLEAIHTVGIIHRDLKTANMMRDAQGIVRLMDFGLAKQWGADVGADVTAAGAIIGTPEYMSPEQTRGQRVDFRSDVYSLGIVVYEIFAGQVPFRADTPYATLLKHACEPLPTDLRIPAALVPVLRKALAKAADERYATARGLAAALQLARAASGEARRPVRAPRPARAEAGVPAAAQRLPALEEQQVAHQAAAGSGSGLGPGPASADRLQALVLGLRDQDVLARWRCAAALADLGPAARDSVPALIEALDDEAESVADAAASALRTIAGDPGPTPEPMPEPSAAAAPPALAALLRAIEGQDASVRWRSVVALGEMGSGAREAVAALIEELDDVEESVRWAAAVALGKIGPAAKDAVRALSAALSETADAVIRRHAASALGKIGPAARDAVPALIAALGDIEPSVRDEAVEALERVGAAAAPALIEALEGEDGPVRAQAAALLARVVRGRPESVSLHGAPTMAPMRPPDEASPPARPGAPVPSESMEVMRRLAGSLAHQFNDILTVILGYTDLLLHGGGASQDYVAEIQKAGEKAASLTGELLAFSRTHPVAPRSLELNAEVGGTEVALRRMLGAGIQLASVLHPAAGRVKADPGGIGRVVVHLVANARDAMPGGGRVIVETRPVDLDRELPGHPTGIPPGRYALLVVGDTGRGMEAETLSRIFEPFFTTKERAAGLGLASVYGIVRQCGGRVRVQSQPGRGTTCEVYLPRVVETMETEQPAPAAAGQPETVLLVEDEEAVRRMARDILQRNGYHVLDAGSGVEALQASRQHNGPIHLLVTDVVMPRMSGHELAEWLTPLHPETRVMYMSGYPGEAAGGRGPRAPAAHFLRKPFTSDALLRTVREVLGGGVLPA